MFTSGKTKMKVEFVDYGIDSIMEVLEDITEIDYKLAEEQITEAKKYVEEMDESTKKTVKLLEEQTKKLKILAEEIIALNEELKNET